MVLRFFFAPDPLCELCTFINNLIKKIADGKLWNYIFKIKHKTGENQKMNIKCTKLPPFNDQCFFKKI